MLLAFFRLLGIVIKLKKKLNYRQRLLLNLNKNLMFVFIQQISNTAEGLKD